MVPANNIGGVVKTYVENALTSVTKAATASTTEVKKMSTQLQQLTNRVEKTTGALEKRCRCAQMDEEQTPFSEGGLGGIDGHTRSSTPS